MGKNFKNYILLAIYANYPSNQRIKVLVQNPILIKGQPNSIIPALDMQIV